MAIDGASQRALAGEGCGPLVKAPLEGSQFGLGAVEVFGDSDVEEDALDRIGGGRDARDFGFEEIPLEGESFRQGRGPGEIFFHDVGPGVDKARARAAFPFESCDPVAADEDSSIAGEVVAVGYGNGQRARVSLVKAQQVGIVGLEEGIAVENEDGWFGSFQEGCADGASGSERGAFDRDSRRRSDLE